MKDNNFLKSVSPKDQQSLRQWFVISMLAFVGSILGIIILQVPQFLLLYKVKIERKQLSNQVVLFDSLVQEKNDVQHIVKTLEHQIAKIDTAKRNAKGIAHLEKLLEVFCHVHVDAIQLRKKDMTATLFCTDAKNAFDVVQRLSESPLFHRVELNALDWTHQDKGFYQGSPFSVSITGKIGDS